MKSPEFYMKAALNAARPYLGSASPNPSVGAAAFDKHDNLIYAAAHTKYGDPHAEAHILNHCQEQDKLNEIQTLAITLEPCNHFGRTPPCTESILNTNIPNIIIGLHDPNPKAAGGIDILRAHNRHVVTDTLSRQAWHQMADFMVSHLTNSPLVILKIAIDETGSMIPEKGEKTFTTAESLTLAHQIRKRCDAILTGSGTVLRDDPEFTVRHIPDFENKKRNLTIMDRRQQITNSVLQNYTKRGFEVQTANDIEKALKTLIERNYTSVLIEAGPQISSAILQQSLWDIAVFIKKNKDNTDRIYTGLNPQKPVLKSLYPFNLYDFLAYEPHVEQIATYSIDDPADTLRHISTLCF